MKKYNIDLHIYKKKKKIKTGRNKTKQSKNKTKTKHGKCVIVVFFLENACIILLVHVLNFRLILLTSELLDMQTRNP